MLRKFLFWGVRPPVTARGLLVALGVSFLGAVPTSVARADEPAQAVVVVKEIVLDKDGTRTQADKETRPYWIGVQLEVAPDLVKAQLKIDYALAIVQVFPDSPAAKVGLKQHDLIIRIGDKAITGPEDVIKGVRDAGEKELKLVVLREGKEQTIAITPAKTPEGANASIAEAPALAVEEANIELKHLEELLRKHEAARSRAGMLFVHPPVAAAPPAAGAAPPWPKQLSVQVQKEGDQPARITVRSGDNKWEVTEDKLDTLPENIRQHIQLLISGKHVGVTVWEGVEAKAGSKDGEGKKLELPARIRIVPGVAPAAPSAPAAPRAIEVFRNEVKVEETDKKLDRILDKLEKLSQDVEALKKK